MATGVGRLDLHKMMGSPDDPERADVYRRGSPVYRAERIEAPLLILHGRKDKRVVPLMTERMVEALEIEGKRFEVHWYDEEAPRLGAAREPARRVRADPRLPEDPRPRRAGRLASEVTPARARGLAPLALGLLGVGQRDHADRSVLSSTARRTSSMRATP